MAKEVMLAAVGDIMLGDSPQVFGFGVASHVRRHGPDYPFVFVHQRLTAADIAVGNLEVAISRFDPDQVRFERQVHRGQPEAVEGLVTAGFDVLSVCTNHMMEHGQAAFEETLELLRSRGIQAIGAVLPELQVSNASVLERGGLRFGFAGYNLRPQQYSLAPPAWPAPSFELIAGDVAALRARADVVVVTLHWGDEFMDQPAPAQVELAHRLVDAGADVILGHHTHSLQGVERYRGAVIAYSLGNFVYDQWQLRLRQSAILHLTVRGTRDMDYRMEPVLINARHQPVPLDGGMLLEAEQRLRDMSLKIGGTTTAAYERELAARYRRFRREIYLHYLTQFWRSNPRYFLANVAGAIRRRL